MGVIGALCLVIALVLWATKRIVLRYNKLNLKVRTKKPEIAVLVAARDESAVIEGLLESLEKQTVKVKPENVYVVVETITDPTVEICKKHGNTVVLRRDLSKQRKGYALDDAVQMIRESGRYYDVYFVFDADNVLAEDYMEQMLKTYVEGYEIATGYRYPKNGNANVIAAVSALTFSIINVVGNRTRAARQTNIVFSGTGFFVVGELVDEWRGWPFHSLTEDYEMSLYATLHGITTTYNEEAGFYDEQPTQFSQTMLQRVRWIKGYFMARWKYVPLMRVKKKANNIGSLIYERIGVKAAIFAIIGAVLVILDIVVWLICTGKYCWAMIAVLIFLVVVYVILAAATMEIIKQEKTKFTPKIKVQAVLFNPIYLASYIPCALKALLSKNVRWQKIEHKVRA